MANGIMVSVICFTYNHEPYIRSALDGFVMQKTNFKYEVLVHDDASTDNTSKIILEYAEKYPDIIKPQIEAENKHQRHIPFDTWKFVQGKYVAFCEGDDYWTDEYKLQKQFDAMEQNPDATMCVHRVPAIWADSGMPDTSCSPVHKPKKSRLSSYDAVSFLKDDYFQTSSHFVRSSIYIDYKKNLPEYTKYTYGDVSILLYCAYKGETIYLDESMSIYRRNTIGSWTSKMKEKTNDQKVKEHQRRITAMTLFDEFSKHQFSKIMNYNIMKSQYWILIWSGNYKKAIFKYPKFYFQNFTSHASKFALLILAKAFFPKLTDTITRGKRRGKL